MLLSGCYEYRTTTTEVRVLKHEVITTQIIWLEQVAPVTTADKLMEMVLGSPTYRERPTAAKTTEHWTWMK